MKLIAADYDGTLRYKERMTKEDIEAIRAWKESGNLFVIDTGRSMESILAETRKYGIPADYYITNNGGMVFDSEQNELFASYLDPVMSLDILYIAKQVGHVVSYVVNDGFHRHRVVVDPSLTEIRYTSLEPDMSEEDVMALGKYAQIVISLTDPEEASVLAERINSHFPHLVSAYANRYVTDVVPCGISKATGLEFLLKHTGMNEEDVYTFGDADNDIPLISFGINGSCMDSAKEEVKQHAKYLYGNITEMIHAISGGEI